MHTQHCYAGTFFKHPSRFAIFVMLVSSSLLASLMPAWSAISGDDLDRCVDTIAHQGKVGRLGVSVLDFERGTKYLYHGNEHFPMQSVFKLPLAVVVLQLVDSGNLSLAQKLSIKREDLSVLYSPLAERFSGSEETFTVSDLIEKVVQESDNTACDVLLRLVGGPEHVTTALKRHGIEGISVDRYERQLQPSILGLPPIDPGQTIDRLKWQKEKQHATGPRARKAFAYYLNDDQRDSSTPDAMLSFLHKLYLCELLTPASTRYLLDVMAGTQTGSHRLREALSPGCIIAHKTGTGPDLNGINSATNDVGIVTLPTGRHFAIAVFLSGSSLTEPERDSVIRNVCNCVVTHIE